MPARVVHSGYAKRLRTDVKTLVARRQDGGGSFSERLVALDRLAGSALLACAAVLLLWVATQLLPASRFEVPSVTESANAASAEAANLDLQLAAGPIAPMTSADVRLLQIRLLARGFNPGPVDGIQGSRTLDALNRYRATKHLNHVYEIDRAAVADLLSDQ